MPELYTDPNNPTSFYQNFGRAYKPEEFRYVGQTAKLPVYEVGGEVPEDIYYLAKGDERITSIHVTMEDLQPTAIPGNGVAYSDAANPCVIVLACLKDRQFFLQHCVGDINEEMREIISRSTDGIAGGGRHLIKGYSDILEASNYRTFKAPTANDTFGLAIVRKAINYQPACRIPRGIYYGWFDIGEIY